MTSLRDSRYVNRSWRNSWRKCRRRPLLSFLCRVWRTSLWKCRRSCLTSSRSRSWRVRMGAVGRRSRDLRGSTGGGWAPPTPSGLHLPPPSPRGFPPGQGGTEILVRDDCGRPFDHAARVPAVQVVRVLRRDSVPSTEFRTFQLCHRREIPQCSP